MEEELVTLEKVLIEKMMKEKKYTCKICNKRYATIQSRWVHYQKCNGKYMEFERLKSENERMQDTLRRTEEIVRLQKKLLKSKRLDTKTFKAVNKILIERSYYNAQNMQNTQNNMQTNVKTVNNNFQIFSVGNEEILRVLTEQQKKQIIGAKMMALEKIVEIAHCGTNHQFKNILITNLKDDYAYKYDEKKGYFVTVLKKDLLDDVVTYRLTDIEAIYDELQSANKIDAKTKKLIQDFLDKMENEETPFVEGEKRFDNFRTYKTNNIKILLYNNQDQITKDVALLMTDSVSSDVVSS
jgi:hypothetical protein